MSIKGWLYSGGHPNSVAKVLNKGWAILHSMGISSNYLVTLEVAGRQSGKLISFSLVMIVMNGERYLVSMLGGEANWVRNVKKANLRHGITEQVSLEEVDVRQRPEIIKA